MNMGLSDGYLDRGRQGLGANHMDRQMQVTVKVLTFIWGDGFSDASISNKSN